MGTNRSTKLAALEAEWEVAAMAPIAGHFLESERFHPEAHPAPDDSGPLFHLYGDVWQWTGSPYVGYPGYTPLAGALGDTTASSCAIRWSCEARPALRLDLMPAARTGTSFLRTRVGSFR